MYFQNCHKYCLEVIHLSRYLILEDGSVYEGVPFGSENESYGEVVFTTSMTGYVESVSDPSYRNQILVFAEPVIANYPVIREHMESSTVSVAGVIAKDSHSTSKHGFGSDFSKFLAEYGVPGIDGIDTRSLILKLRRNGVMKGYISDQRTAPVDWPDPMIEDVVAKVTEGDRFPVYPETNGTRILNINLGEKYSLLREMGKIFSLESVNHTFDFNSIADDYEAVFVSNGPGDPASPYLSNVAGFLRKQVGVKPIIGVCLGHQLVSIACGLKTVKMHFGHRGSNHAVTDGIHNWITTHNHGYAVINREDSGLITRMWDVNDGTVEMLESEKNRILTVQFHPEASPGPSDSKEVFRMFSRIVKDGWYE